MVSIKTKPKTKFTGNHKTNKKNIWIHQTSTGHQWAPNVSFNILQKSITNCIPSWVPHRVILGGWCERSFRFCFLVLSWKTYGNTRLKNYHVIFVAFDAFPPIYVPRLEVRLGSQVYLWKPRASPGQPSKIIKHETCLHSTENRLNKSQSHQKAAK